jgi:hypothetical protein
LQYAKLISQPDFLGEWLDRHTGSGMLSNRKMASGLAVLQARRKS